MDTEDKDTIEPTSKKELWAWYINDWANSAFPNVGNGFCIPLLLTSICQQQACQDARCNVLGESLDPNEESVLWIGSVAIRPESFAFYMISISGMLQAVVFCGVGPIADYGNSRKILFNVSSICGGIGVCLYYLLWDTSTWYLAGILVIILNVLYGLSTIAYNAYLPLLVESHPKVINAINDGKNPNELEILVDHLTNEISQIGFGIGYAGTIVSVIVTVVLLMIFPAINYHIDQTAYGYTAQTTTNSDHVNFRTFEELIGQKVSDVDIFHTSNQLYSMQFHYKDSMYNTFAVNPGDYDGNTNIIENIYNDSNQISSVKLWTSSDTSTITGIQFYDGSSESTVFGDDSSSNQESIASHKSKWILGGWSGTIATDTNEPNESFLTAISFLWIDPDSDSLWNTTGYRISLLACGIWWLVFALFPIFNLKKRPGPPFPIIEKWYLLGFKQVISTIKDAKENKQMFYYLLGWFLWSDGLNTFSSAAVIFASIEFGFGGAQYGILLLLSLFFALIGNFLFLGIEKKFHIRQKTMLLFHLCIMAILPIYVGLGLIPSLPFGVKSELEFYVCVAIFGINNGSLQSYSRSVFAMLIPEGKETEMFALFEITNKGSSWMGTLLIAIVSNFASIRWGIFYVFFFFAIPIPLLYSKVDITAEEELEAKQNKHSMPRNVQFGFERSKTLFHEPKVFTATLKRSSTFKL